MCKSKQMKELVCFKSLSFKQYGNFSKLSTVGMLEVMLVEVILIAIIQVLVALVGVFWIARVLSCLSQIQRLWACLVSCG